MNLDAYIALLTSFRDANPVAATMDVVTVTGSGAMVPVDPPMMAGVNTPDGYRQLVLL